MNHSAFQELEVRTDQVAVPVPKDSLVNLVSLASKVVEDHQVRARGQRMIMFPCLYLCRYQAHRFVSLYLLFSPFLPVFRATRT